METRFFLCCVGIQAICLQSCAPQLSLLHNPRHRRGSVSLLRGSFVRNCGLWNPPRFKQQRGSLSKCLSSINIVSAKSMFFIPRGFILKGQSLSTCWGENRGLQLFCKTEPIFYKQQTMQCKWSQNDVTHIARTCFRQKFCCCNRFLMKFILKKA